MKTTARSVSIVFFLLAAFIPAQGKDEVIRVSYPSKVEASKGKEREKLFTPWMSTDNLRTQTDEKRKKGEQIIYFEYNNATWQVRAIYLSKFKLNGPYSRWYYTNESDMEEKLNSEMKNGLVPAFIVRGTSGAYTMLLVSPQDLAAARTQLKALGIGEARLKK